MTHDHADTPVPGPEPIEDEPSLLCDEEDLFDFPPLDVAFEETDPFLDLDPFAEDQGPLVEDDGASGAEATTESTETPESTDTHGDEAPDPDAADVFPDAGTPAGPPAGEVEPAGGPPADAVTSQSAPMSQGSSFPVVHALIACALMLNLSLVAIVWRTSTGLGQSLEGMRSDMNHVAKERELQQALLAVQASRNNRGEQSIGSHGSNAAGPMLSEPATSPVTDAASHPAHLALHFARQEMADGQPALARRRLFRLLCEMDRLGLDAAQEAEARFMIAAAYTLEAGVRPTDLIAEDSR